MSFQKQLSHLILSINYFDSALFHKPAKYSGKMPSKHFDALVVGAGFSGLYQLYKLRELGLSVQLVEIGEDVGGTWYWNHYPGASSDTYSHVYRYSWDKEDLQTYPWDSTYLTQPEVHSYLRHVADKHHLRDLIQFNTGLTAARYDESLNVWQIELSTKELLTTHYLVTALGPLSRQNVPSIKNIDFFQGQVYHSADWPKHHDFSDKRVGIIGNGSTGSQLLVALAKHAKHVTSFQRTPQWNVPNNKRSVTAEERAKINADYDRIWNEVFDSRLAFGFKESNISTFSVSDGERQKMYEEEWNRGNGATLMAVFNDIVLDKRANETVCDFMRGKIAEAVKDPETRCRLTPTEPFARRPITNDGYYETFNRDNVRLVSLRETPIDEMVKTGLKTSDGIIHRLDVLILATGFDACTGIYNKVDIRGRNGETLKAHWANGASAYLGVSVPGFPNLFTVFGPNAPFVNMPPAAETQVRFITDLIQRAGNNGVVDSQSDAEKQWTDLSNQILQASLLSKVATWATGKNIPGKKATSLFFMGGLKMYRQLLDDVVSKGYTGFDIHQGPPRS